MKNVILTIILFTNFSHAQNSLPYGQIAYFPFDGNAKDFSGKNNHGKLINNPKFTTDRNGKSESALLLNGKDQYVLVPNSPSLNNLSSEITICAWVKVNGWYAANYDAWAALFCKCDQSSPYLQFALRKSDDEYYYHTEGSPSKTVQIKPDIKIGQWFHIGIVVNKNRRDFFYNGKLINHSDNYPEIQPSNNPLYIGLDPHTIDDYLIGAIDEVLTFNRPLSASEVQQIYNNNPESEEYSLEGRIIDRKTEKSIVGEIVLLSKTNDRKLIKTNLEGYYSVKVKPSQSYNVSVYSDGFNTFQSVLSTTNEKKGKKDFYLQQVEKEKAPIIFKGKVVNSKNNLGIESKIVFIVNGKNTTLITESDGIFELPLYEENDYSITVSSNNFVEKKDFIKVKYGDILNKI
jgi:hypothetical protein